MEVRYGYTLQTGDPFPLLNKKTRYAIRKAEQHLKIRRGTLSELRKLHWNPSYLPVRLPVDMRVFVATLNGGPVSAVAIVEEPNNRRIIYKYSGNNPNFKHLQGNAYLLCHIAEMYDDMADFIDLGGGSEIKPDITAFKRRMSTGSYEKPVKKKNMFTKLNYRLGSWIPNKFADLFREQADAPYYMVLNYHETTPEIFEDHIEYLDRHYSLTSLDRLRDHYRYNTPISDDACFITFDDGWKSNYELLTVIEGYLLPLTIFLSTGYTGTNLDPRTKTEPSKRSMLNETEILELVEQGVNFQSHGVSHTKTKDLTADSFISELDKSKRFIETLTGKPVYAFAYPYNRPHHDGVVKNAGYELARIGDRMFNTNKQDKYLINSIGVDGTWTVDQLKQAIRKASLKTWSKTV